MYTNLPAYKDGTVCSETLAYKIQTPGNHPKESIQQILFSFSSLILIDITKRTVHEGGGVQNNCTKFYHSACFVPNGLVSQMKEGRDVV